MRDDYSLTGIVSSGLGRAHIFMAQAHYQEQFKQVLGVTAWPGTLNVTLEEEDLSRFVALRNLSGIETSDLSANVMSSANEIDLDHIPSHRIEGFMRDGVSFGGATAFAAWFSTGNEKPFGCAILIPDLTRHTSVMEVICSRFLREKYDLEDGDAVTLVLA
jgi:CTP-dependent riboflavin kinase